MLPAGAGCSLSRRGDLHGPQADQGRGQGGGGGGEGGDDQQGGQDRHVQSGERPV